MSYVLIMIFSIYARGYAKNNAPEVPVVVHAEFNSKEACHAAAKVLQSKQRANEVYCVPKG